ncbi:MAG: ATP-binding protein [Acidobacteriota bacterium]
MSPSLLSPARPFRGDESSQDAVALAWLVMVRWAGVAAGAGAIFAGWRGLGVPTSFVGPTLFVVAGAVSNIWLAYRLRRRPTPPLAIGGWLVSADVVGLSALLLDSGGILNPVSIFYLVDIVLAALVLGRVWTWIVTTLSITGYGVLFLMPSQQLRAARLMHPEIAMHVEGMWLAFGATSLIVALVVARLATLIERRDRALMTLRERRNRDAHMISLATLAAGAAHELSTPLGTIAVAARELERSLADVPGAAARHEDVRLIRSEIDRCKRVLQDMAGRSGELAGEAPTPQSLSSLETDLLALLPPDDRARLDVSLPSGVETRWPVGAVSRAIVNIVRNGIQASSNGDRVSLSASHEGDRVIFTIADRGAGMSPHVQSRAGEPFFTTRPEGSGMGLGLFVTVSTIDQLGGTMHLRSNEGEGTTITITLPRDATRGPDSQP